MTLTTYTLEGTQGSTVAATGMVLAGAGAVTYDSAMAGVGVTGAKVINTAANVRVMRITWPTSSKTFAVDFIATLPTVMPPSGVRYILATLRRTLPAAGVVVQFQVNQNGQVGWEAGTTGFVPCSASGLAAGSKLRIMGRIVVGVATSAPFDTTFTMKCYTSGSNWTVQNGSTSTDANAVANTQDFGTTAVTNADFGICSVAPAAAVTVGIDTIRGEDGRTTDFGAPPTASPPTAAASASDFYPEVGTSVNLTSAGSTAGSGSITGWAWSCPTPPDGASAPAILNPNTATASFTPSVGSRYTFQLVVTQTGGLTDTTTVTVYPHEASSDDIGVYAVTLGSWSSEGSPPAATPKIAVNDGLATTYLKSPTNPAGELVNFTMDPYGPGSISVFVAGNWTGGTLNRTVNVYMEDGTTLLETDTYALTSVEVDHEVILDAGSLATATAGLNRRALKGTVGDA